MLDKEMEKLKKLFLDEANLAIKMVKRSIEGLVKEQEESLHEVIKKLEPVMNDTEIEVDEKCINIIALFQPKASILREVMMIYKMNNDMERIGDLAVNISESALYLIKRPKVKPLIDIPRMAEEATKMLEDSVKSFLENDPKLAKDVCERDDIVDGLRDQIIRELITYMTSDPSTIERSLHLMRITKNLERVADLATNIGEDVIYVVEGQVIKHGRGERKFPI